MTNHPATAAWGVGRRGPRPSMRVGGGEDADPRAIAADLTQWWSQRLATLPQGAFPAPAWLRGAKLDSAIRRGWVERRGLDGRAWTYALTPLGSAIVAALGEATPANIQGPA